MDATAGGVPAVTAGSRAHLPEAALGAAARAAPLSVSQPSAGQESAATACTTRLPAEPSPASRHRAGDARQEMSVHSRPGIPTRTTGREPGATESVLARSPAGANPAAAGTLAPLRATPSSNATAS